VTALPSVPRSWLAAAGLALATGMTGIAALPTTSSAAVPRVPFDPPVSDQRAVTLLRDAYDAGRTLAYAGTAFVGLGSSYVRVRLRHVPGQGTWVAPDDPTSSAQTLQPDAVSTSPDNPLAMLQEHYQLLLGGSSRVAGRPVVEVRADRVDGGLAAVFEVDRQTHLVLSRSAYDTSGERYEQVVFTAVSVAAAPLVALGNSRVIGTGGPLARADTARGREMTTSSTGVGGLRAAGWHVDERLPGGFALYDARVARAGSAAVLHLSYSDGLTSLSLFEERGRLEAPLPGWTTVAVSAAGRGRTVYADGSSPQRLAWQGGGTVYALLSDAAPARVADVVASLPYGQPRTGVLDRLHRGFDRLGSWIDPLH
jgi:sigma-E factor negative regulatory protein RseB